MSENFNEWIENKDPELKRLIEDANRYSVEVNYRSNMQEVIDAFAKLVLGYVSAGMKQIGYHTKILFTEKPYRVIVSTRNWDDGEWVGIACYNTKENCFVIAAGHYNKDKKTISVQRSKKCAGNSAVEIVRELRNYMEVLKREKPRESGSLEPAKLKRGPKPSLAFKKIKKSSGPWKI